MGLPQVGQTEKTSAFVRYRQQSGPTECNQQKNK
jgi:hypothetical protein